MVKRVTRKTRCCYNTASKKIRQVKTPGGRLVAHFIKKVAKGPHCKESKIRLGVSFACAHLSTADSASGLLIGPTEECSHTLS